MLRGADCCNGKQMGQTVVLYRVHGRCVTDVWIYIPNILTSLLEKAL